MPVIDTHRSEGTVPCVHVCPNNVFEILHPTRTERSVLPLKARVKEWVHGGSQAFAMRADICQGCGLRVLACPGNVITLARKPRAVADVTPRMAVVVGSVCGLIPWSFKAGCATTSGTHSWSLA